MKSISIRRWPLLFLVLLISADLVFVGLEVVHSLGYASDNKFLLGTERGYSEVYQYVKFFWIALILAWLTFRTYQPLYGIGTFLFMYLLLDDSLEIHETMGGHIAAWTGMSPLFGLRTQDYGELTVYALTGIIFLGAGWLAYQKSSRRARQISWYVLGGLVGLAVFGAGVDMLHSFFSNSFPFLDTPFVILEDGGELIAVSVIAWFIFSFASQE
ncbi:MAG: hypothetical protein U5K69_27365 [Balneolaceae bacterium]|nr:hypothetical protein [Balneolaceae bacterium]